MKGGGNDLSEVIEQQKKNFRKEDKMQERQTKQKRRHRYWPFNRYAGCWWQHPYYCEHPSLREIKKPTLEDEEDLKDDNNMLDQVIIFAKRFKRA
jgi:hypothetical protein